MTDCKHVNGADDEWYRVRAICDDFFSTGSSMGNLRKADLVQLLGYVIWHHRPLWRHATEITELNRVLGTPLTNRVTNWDSWNRVRFHILLNRYSAHQSRLVGLMETGYYCRRKRLIHCIVYHFAGLQLSRFNIWKKQLCPCVNSGN